MAAPVTQNPIIKVDLTHSKIGMRIPEVRLSLMEPICEIKLSLVSRFGTGVDFMHLELKDRQLQHVAFMKDELRPFGYYSPEEGYTVHVIIF